MYTNTVEIFISGTMYAPGKLEITEKEYEAGTPEFKACFEKAKKNAKVQG